MKSESFFVEMNCQQCREECERLLDESLPIEQRSVIEANISAHIDTCPECAGEFALVQNLRLTLPQMQTALVEPPTFLRANIRAALVEEAQAKSQKKFSFALPIWTRSMWAGGLVLAFGFVIMSQQLIPFSDSTLPQKTTMADSSDESDSPVPSAVAPRSASQSKNGAAQKPQLKRQATKANSEILPERIPAPRQRVFSAPAPSVKSPQPLVLPEVKVEREKPTSTKSHSPERPKATVPTKASTKKAPASANLTAPVQELAPSSAAKVTEKPAVQPAPAPIKPAVPSELFMARSNADNRPEKAPGGGADSMAGAAMDVATPDWRNGKITLALVPTPRRSTFSAKSTNNAVSAPEAFAPPAPINNPPTTKSADGTVAQEATSEANEYANGNLYRKEARGGGDVRMRVKPVPPALANPSIVAPSIQKAEPSAVIPRKLTLQSEFAVPNARLRQNDTVIWEGDLPAKKPLTIEWMTPLSTDEKISFVLEQFGPNGESNRKSLNLGD